jgi:hypothetical protein
VTTPHQVGQAGVAKRVDGDGYVCLLTQAAQREVNGADGQPAPPWVKEQSRLIWLLASESAAGALSTTPRALPVLQR